MRLVKLGVVVSTGVLLFVAASIQAKPFNKEGSSYVGAGIGLSDYTFIESPVILEGQVRTISLETSVPSFSFFWGYNLKNNLSFELLYQDFGEAELLDRTTLVSGSDTYVYEDRLKGEITGFAFVAKGYLPIGDRLNLYGKAGLMMWEMNSTISYSEYLNGKAYAGPEKYPAISFRETDPYISLGAEFEMFDNLSLYADANYLHGAHDDENYHTFAFMAGINYRYGSITKYRKEGAADRSRAITACDPKFKDVVGLICEEVAE